MFCAGLFSIADLLDSDCFGHELPFVPVLRVSHRLRNGGITGMLCVLGDCTCQRTTLPLTICTIRRCPPHFKPIAFVISERISILGGAELQRCKNGEAMRLQPLAYLRG